MATTSTPGMMSQRWPSTGPLVVGGFRFTQHALERCREMGLDLATVVEVLRQPLRSYPSPNSYGEGRRVAADAVLAVVYSADDSVITVLWNGAEGRRTEDSTPRRAVAS